MVVDYDAATSVLELLYPLACVEQKLGQDRASLRGIDA